MLYVVHCVDTEGPLFEPLEATFQRLKAIYGVDLPPDATTLAGLQAGAVDLGDPALQRSIARTFEPQQLEYKPDWPAVLEMLGRLDSPGLRRAVPDSAGQDWFINWHCMDHYGYDPHKNPRRRDLRPHAVFDVYRARYEGDWGRNSLHWHFHPVPATRQANHCATSFLNNPAIFQVISRRLLERLWFPCVNRPGFHSERPDSHWFLEQWLPYDYANNNIHDPHRPPDLNSGRFGDWRRAPLDWVVYHPAHDDYQQAGSCRRAIARCLNLEGRFNALTEAEVEKAFLAARAGKDVILSFSNHDFRDMERGIRFVQSALRTQSATYPEVEWRYADAAQAMRAVLKQGDEPHGHFDLTLAPLDHGAARLDIRFDRAIFGPQPWFCYRTRAGDIVYDNLDWELEPGRWSYVFDEQTCPAGEIDLVGLATNTRNGRTTVAVLEGGRGRCVERVYN